MARSAEEIYQDLLQLSEDERELLLLRLTNEMQGCQENNGWAESRDRAGVDGGN